ncbi:MAG: Nramp family divalent metal transporter [bacterium]|nr:Nramp family divalent metal transporter [bacterium]
MSDQPHKDHSLSEVHGTVAISQQVGTWKRLFAFAGPAYLVSVGYMDPGNWATDLAGGSKYGYTLIWVLLMSNAMAVLLQSLSARLGIVSGRDLAQACRDYYPKWINIPLWLLCEVAIAACDLAEVVGSAIGLQLLFGLPLLYGVMITAFDTMLLLFLHQLGIRKMEAFILMLVTTIGVCLGINVFIARPELGGILSGVIPSLPDSGALYIAIGILGATVMPHNLYLHSALVQSRRIEKSPKGIKQAIKYNLIDSTVALNAAFFVNAAILVLAAATFYRAGYTGIAEIQDAHKFLEPLLGVTLAPILFAVALIASGQSSTITGTLAGQIVMEGFVNFRLRPWLRRMITRGAAIVPALFTIIYFGERSTGALLILSQVVLSLQLPFAVIPLVHFVSDKKRMGDFAIPTWTRTLAWVVTAVIVGLNAQLVWGTVIHWVVEHPSWYVYAAATPLAIFITAILGYVTLRPWVGEKLRLQPLGAVSIHGDPPMPDLKLIKPFRRVALALDFKAPDTAVISHGASLAASGATLILIHVVESAAARTLGADIEDQETQLDRQRLERYGGALQEMGYHVEIELGFGRPTREIPRLVELHQADLLIMGAHGHRKVGDLLYGTTADSVRHRVKTPVMIVGGERVNYE